MQAALDFVQHQIDIIEMWGWVYLGITHWAPILVVGMVLIGAGLIGKRG